MSLSRGASSSSSGAVALGRAPSTALDSLAEQVRAVAAQPDAEGRLPDLGAAVELARRVGADASPGGPAGWRRPWEVLATLGAGDLTLARVVEPHLDALSILEQARASDLLTRDDVPGEGVWGVYAAEGGPARLRATREDGGGWRLDGSKPWCSLADRADRALVTAWVEEDQRGLFAIDLGEAGVRLGGGAPWVSRGLSQVRSTGLDLEGVAATAVGPPGWYLERPGFAWGGIGVAAVWYGATVALARRLRSASLARTPDQLALAHLGAVDAAVRRAGAVLHEAVEVTGSADLTPSAARRTALVVRQVVAGSAEEVLQRVGHALGPGPLANDEEHARRVADLTVYVRQQHAERDDAALGAAVLDDLPEGGWRWW